MNERIKCPCYTTHTGLRIGSLFDEPPRRDFMNDEELFWQRVYMPHGSRLERFMPKPEVLWKWAAIVAWCVVFVVLGMPKAHAQFMTGNKLLERMNGSLQERAYAGGYVIGVHDAWRGEFGCSPNDATAGQVSDVVRQFLETNPQHRHQSAEIIIGAALHSTWPCPKKKGSSL